MDWQLWAAITAVFTVLIWALRMEVQQMFETQEQRIEQSMLAEYQHVRNMLEFLDKELGKMEKRLKRIERSTRQPGETTDSEE